MNQPLRLDTESNLVGIENRASACIYFDKKEFLRALSNTKRFIKGYVGSTICPVMMVTIRWYWLDNMRKQHKFYIPDLYYNTDRRVRLLSPQHWVKEYRASYW